MAYSSKNPKTVDIYIREVSGSRQIRVPWLPEEITYSNGGTTVATYEILNTGAVAVPMGYGLAKVSWEGTWPGGQRTDKKLLRGSWKEPSHYHNILEKWKKNGTKLNLMVTGYPINLNVLLEAYAEKPSGGFGDVEYKIEFIEDRDLTVSKKTKKKTKKKATTTKRPAKKTTTYTVKKGDNLWTIAKRFLGSGSKWRTLYNANKTIIEQTAKKYGKKSSDKGWWIYPGVKIKIPQ